jgi:hypothetical protein
VHCGGKKEGEGRKEAGYARGREGGGEGERGWARKEEDTDIDRPEQKQGEKETRKE